VIAALAMESNFNGSLRYTDAEDAVLRENAKLVNQKYITYRELADKVAEVGPVPRDERSIWNRLRRLGLQKNLFPSRREIAEAKHFRPFLTKAECDRMFQLWDDYVVPSCVCCMLENLIERMTAGNPPSVTRKGGRK
jgi:hypothetical protein